MELLIEVLQGLSPLASTSLSHFTTLHATRYKCPRAAIARLPTEYGEV